MHTTARRSGDPAAAVAAGRYAVFHAGRECGADRWRLDHAGDHLVLSGEQILEAPHPFPNHQLYRAALTPDYRLLGLEVRWTVGVRELRARHASSEGRWRVRIELGGQVREQEGDFPMGAEVEFTTPMFQQFILSRRDFRVGGEHEFPVLRIGPPLMAVSPERMLLRCVEEGEFAAPWGRVKARRYTVSLPPRPEAEGYTFWADAHDRVLVTFEGPQPGSPWMRLVEYATGG